MKTKHLILLLICMLSISSCSLYNNIWDAINGLDERLTAVEQTCEQLNTNVNALQQLLNALSNEERITSVTELENVGWVITFTSGKSITIYSNSTSSAPQISIDLDANGNYYWTLNGEWILDNSGNKIQANGITPLFKIEDNYWFVSYDNGITWIQLDQANNNAGGNIFTNIYQDENNVYFVLTDGTTIILPKTSNGTETPNDTTSITPNSNGMLTGAFSVSATKQVCFSQGNLQYQASTNTWRFAEHQWDIIGMGYGQTNSGTACYNAGNVHDGNNTLISSTYEGWIDCFGWGTGDNPTKTSTSDGNYTTFSDWCEHPIINGGNQAYQWRVLTRAEWSYIFESRANASSKRGIATVNGICGMVILPDSWTLPEGCTFKAGFASKSGTEYYQTVNNINPIQWQAMENAGAVFLPAAGIRVGTQMNNVGLKGYYWSSTPDASGYAFGLYYFSTLCNFGSGYRHCGYTVRAVKNL